MIFAKSGYRFWRRQEKAKVYRQMERNVDDRQCLLELPDISQISQV
jgi:hypothetical protein